VVPSHKVEVPRIRHVDQRNAHDLTEGGRECLVEGFHDLLHSLVVAFGTSFVAAREPLEAHV